MPASTEQKIINYNNCCLQKQCWSFRPYESPMMTAPEVWAVFCGLLWWPEQYLAVPITVITATNAKITVARAVRVL